MRLHKLHNEEKGFVFASAAIVVAVILGIAIVYLTRSQAINSMQAADTYSGSQSYWSALSGVEYAIENSVDLENVPGTYTYYNGSVTLSTSSLYQNGNQLPDGSIRLISKGIHGETYRRLEVLFEVVYNQDFWPELSLIQEIEHEDNLFNIHNNFGMNGSLYIGGNVYVQCSDEGDDDDDHDDDDGHDDDDHGDDDEGNCASMGDPPGLPTTLYVPTGNIVTGSFNSHFGWSTIAPLQLPVMDLSPYTSRITSAYEVTETSGNEYLGNYSMSSGVLDISQYEGNVFYINGKLTLKGVTVAGGTIIEPGIIVTTGKVDLMNLGLSPTVIGDNIIIISDSDITFHSDAQFGTNYSGLPPEDWPATVNLIYSNDKISINHDTDVWGQIISPSEIQVHGNAHGVIWCGDQFEFNDPNAFFEGALYVHHIDDPHDQFVNGYMNLHHIVPINYFEGLSYQVVEGTLNEF